jgi:molybdopterin synthase catalytic subunit
MRYRDLCQVVSSCRRAQPQAWGDHASVRVQTDDFDVGQEVARLRARDRSVGAIASFIGTVRDVNDAATITGMTLEHYPGMTEAALEEIVDEAHRRFDIRDALVIHRVGALAPGDQIVLVVVTSAHRGMAFDACEYVMDLLKTRAPFWKKERMPDGERWVEARASDDEAAERW